MEKIERSAYCIISSENNPYIPVRPYNPHMIMKLYMFRFSPPARLAQFASMICGLEPEYVEVDLSKAEQFQAWYTNINAKHKVPVLEEDGQYMDESVVITKHLFNKYNKNPDNDHWYPKDPEKRAEVDEWLEWVSDGKGDWKTAIHLTIRTAIVLSHMAPQHGMGWRNAMGVMLIPLGMKARKDQQAKLDLKKQVDVAEEILRKRKIATVKDLNLGDVAAFMEISVVMECAVGYFWSDYPYLEKLYQLLREVPGFMKIIHQPFLDFCREYRHLRDAGTTAGWSELANQVITSVVFILKIVMTGPGWIKGLVWRPEISETNKLK